LQLGAEDREGEFLVENVLLEAVHDILESEELDNLLDECEKKPPFLIGPSINNQDPPSCEDLSVGLPQTTTQFANQNGWAFEEELKEVTGMDDREIFRKRMFKDEAFVGMLEFMMEDTLFNLMEEATYEEFDLTQAPKIYIRKEDLQKQQQQD